MDQLSVLITGSASFQGGGSKSLGDPLFEGARFHCIRTSVANRESALKSETGTSVNRELYFSTPHLLLSVEMLAAVKDNILIIRDSNQHSKILIVV